MNNIIAYDMVSSANPKELIEVIDSHIKLGWQPYGAPITEVNYDKETGKEIITISQALVKYSKP
jgi:hypothetical protein